MASRRANRNPSASPLHRVVCRLRLFFRLCCARGKLQKVPGRAHWPIVLASSPAPSPKGKAVQRIFALKLATRILWGPDRPVPGRAFLGSADLRELRALIPLLLLFPFWPDAIDWADSIVTSWPSCADFGEDRSGWQPLIRRARNRASERHRSCGRSLSETAG
jgi:hypothetical protein